MPAAPLAALWPPWASALCGALGTAYLVAIPSARPAQKIGFFLGLLCLYAAVGTPLAFLGDRYLLSARMLAQCLIVFGFAPLFLLGLPGHLLRPARAPVALRLAEKLGSPVPAFLLFNVGLALVSVPAVGDLALRSPLARALDLAALIGLGLLAWWPVLGPAGRGGRRLSEPGQLLYLFAMEVAMTLLFAVFTFAGRPLDPAYARAPRIAGISPLEDQQLAGVVLRASSFLSFGVAFVAAFLRWVRREEARAARIGGMGTAAKVISLDAVRRRRAAGRHAGRGSSGGSG